MIIVQSFTIVIERKLKLFDGKLQLEGAKTTWYQN